MDKSQFQTPQTIYSEKPNLNIEKAAIPHTPEFVTPPFQFTKDIESLVDSIRETGEAIEQKKGREVRLKFVPITFARPARTHREILEEQLNIERSLTSDMFSEKGRYSVWYGGKTHTPQETPNIASWFIEDQQTGRVTRIQTHPDYIQMFNHEGKLVSMTLNDLEVFVSLVRHYVPTILRAYPFENDRIEVILDGINIPDNAAMLLPPEHVDGQKMGYTLAA